LLPVSIQCYSHMHHVLFPVFVASNLDIPIAIYVQANLHMYTIKFRFYIMIYQAVDGIIGIPFAQWFRFYYTICKGNSWLSKDDLVH